jgi:hypothetical protein
MTRRVTLEFAKDHLGLPWWNSSIEFSPFFDHKTRTIPEWVIFPSKRRKMSASSEAYMKLDDAITTCLDEGMEPDELVELVDNAIESWKEDNATD